MVAGLSVAEIVDAVVLVGNGEMEDTILAIWSASSSSTSSNKNCCWDPLEKAKYNVHLVLSMLQ